MEDPHTQLPALFEKYSIDPTDVCSLMHLKDDDRNKFYDEYIAYQNRVRLYEFCRTEAQKQVQTSVFRGEHKPVRTSKQVALTICPQEHTTHTTLVRIMEHVRTLTVYTAISYCFEQRSEGDEPEYGWHVHMVVTTDYAPSKVKQFVQQKLSRAGITATYYATRADENWYLHYMQGEKHDPKKEKKVMKDTVLRERYNLQKIYEIKTT